VTYLKRFDVRVGAIYVVVAVLWMILSDPVTALIADTTGGVFAAWKGLGFVAVMAPALVLVISGELRRRGAAEQALRRDMLERRRAEEAERAQGRFAEALRDSVVAISASLDVDEVMRKILDAAAAVVPSEAGSIVLFEEGEARIAYTRGFSPQTQTVLQDFRFANQTPAAASAFGNSRPYLIADTRTDPNWVELPFTNWIRSSIGVPVDARGQVIGMLVADSAEAGHFQQADVEKLEVFARYAALALENAYHVTRLERSVEERTAQLQSAKVRVEAILNSSLDGIVLAYTNLKIQQTNATFNTLLACDFDDYFDRSLLDLIHEDEVETVKAALEGVIARGAGRQIETRVRRRDGTAFEAELSIGYIRDLHDEMDSLVCALRDITERKQAEQAQRESEARLRESQQMLQNILETIPVRVFWKDRSSVYMGCNRLFMQDAGVKSPEEIIGKRDDEMIWRGRADSYRAADESILRGEHSFMEYEQIVTGADGEEHCFHNYKVPLKDLQGEIIGVLGMYTDITERKQSEDTLRKAFARERELGELKSRFVSMASHELRTPLTSIMSAAEIVRRYRARMDEAQIDEKLRLIARQVEHLTSIIEDVLNLGRIQAGHGDFHPTEVDLDALCREIVAEFESHPSFHHRIDYRGAPLAHWVDRTLMRQVITNLISNAVKYSPASQTVWVALERRGGGVVLCVRDAGIGIPAADMNHLFEPFHRARNVGAISGTGLGLAISKEAVEMHGGTISVESEVDVGTTFYVHLPGMMPQT
jgi:PAS domain S-box-containing protein